MHRIYVFARACTFWTQIEATCTRHAITKIGWLRATWLHTHVENIELKSENKVGEFEKKDVIFGA